MPHLIDRPDDLQLSLALRQERTRFFVTRAIRRPHLQQPLRQLDARGPYVPSPPPQSRQAIVKLWPAAAQTTAAHSRYLERGKGLDGTDAPLFDATGQPPDRQAFAARAVDDPHQFRFIVALVPPVALHWERFTRQLMAVVSRDLRAPLDWLGAVHHDTKAVHVHVQLRGRTAEGHLLYLAKDYYRHGLRFRVQELATVLLGALTPTQQQRERERLPEVTRDVTASPVSTGVRLGPLTIEPPPATPRYYAEGDRPHVAPTVPHAHGLRPEEVRARLDSAGAAIQRLRAQTQRVADAQARKARDRGR